MISALIGWPMRRPMFALIVLVLLAMFGAVSFSYWPIERLPSIPNPALRVQADLPGVDALQVETAVARPLENALAPLPGLREILTRSREGRVTIDLRFTSVAARHVELENVRKLIAETIFALPTGISAPVVEREEPPPRPAAVYAITVDRFSDEFVAWTESALAQPLRQLAEVGAVSIGGAENHEVLVEPDPRRLAALGLSFDDVIKALRGSDKAPRRRAAHRSAVSVPASVEAIAARAVRLPDGDMLALGEIAEVSVTAQSAVEQPRYDGAPALLLRVYSKSPDFAVAVAERVNAHIGWMRANGLVRSGVGIHSLVDEARETRQWYRSIRRLTAGYVAAVLLAVYLFFGWRACSTYFGAFVVWLLASAGAIWAFGVALNVMSVAALMLACVPFTMMVIYLLSPIVVAALVAATATLFFVGSEAMQSAAQIAMAFSVATLVAAVVAWLVKPWLDRDSMVSVLLARVPSAYIRSWSRIHSVSLMMMFIAIAAGICLRLLFVTAPNETDGTFVVRIRGEDAKQLVASGEELLTRLRATPDLQSVETSWAIQQQWQLRLDPDRMVEAELSLADVGRALAIAHNGLLVGEVADADARLPLRVQLAPGASGPGFERLLLRGEYKDRRAVYLRDVGVVQRVMIPREVLRLQQQPAVEIRSRLRTPESTATVTQLSESVSLPTGYSIYWTTVSGVAEWQDRP